MAERHDPEHPHSPLALEFGEKMISIIRRHLVNLAPVLVSSGVIILASFYASYWLGLHADELPSMLPAGWISFALIGIDVAAVVIFILGVYVYRQNRLILTNLHLIQVTQNGLFDRSLSKLSLQQLQDVKGTRRGFFATMFDYGELLVESAGEDENFLFRPVGDPIGTAELINDAREQYMREHGYGVSATKVETPAEPAPSSTDQPT